MAGQIAGYGIRLGTGTNGGSVRFNLSDNQIPRFNAATGTLVDSGFQINAITQALQGDTDIVTDGTVQSGVSTLQLGIAHAVRSAAENVTFRNLVTNVVFHPTWQTTTSTGDWASVQRTPIGALVEDFVFQSVDTETVTNPSFMFTSLPFNHRLYVVSIEPVNTIADVTVILQQRNQAGDFVDYWRSRELNLTAVDPANVVPQDIVVRPFIDLLASTEYRLTASSPNGDVQVLGNAAGVPRLTIDYRRWADLPLATQQFVNSQSAGLSLSATVDITADVTITSANASSYDRRLWQITGGSWTVTIAEGAGLTFFGLYVRRASDTGTITVSGTDSRINGTTTVTLQGMESSTWFAIRANRYNELYNNFRPRNFENLDNTPDDLGDDGQLVAVRETGGVKSLVFINPSAASTISASNVTLNSRRLTGLLSSASNAQTAFDRIDATGLGADINRFSGNYVATNANVNQWLNRHVQGQDGQANGRRTFTLPPAADLTTSFNSLMSEGLPETIRITISYLGGPSSSFVTNNLNVRAAAGGPEFGFSQLVNLIRNDSVTMEIRRTGTTIGTWQQVARGVLQTTGGTELDDLEFQESSWNAAANSFLPGADDVLKGYAFRVINAPADGSGRFGQVLYTGDWVVWTANTYTAWTDTNNWIVIAAGDVRRISATQAQFLNTISETEVITAGAAVPRVRFWLLETLPTVAPQLADGQTDSFTSASAITNRFLLVAVPNNNMENDIVLQNAETGTTTVTDFAPAFVDYASVIPDNSNGSYFLLGTSTTAGTPFTLSAGATLTVRQRVSSAQFRANNQFRITRANLDTELLAAIFP